MNTPNLGKQGKVYGHVIMENGREVLMLDGAEVEEAAVDSKYVSFAIKGIRGRWICHPRGFIETCPHCKEEK
jgi:hypothetical protein